MKLHKSSTFRRIAFTLLAILLLGIVAVRQVVLPVQAQAVNLSQGKPVICSSTETTSTACTYAVDGNTGTRWSSAFSDPQWIQVDLGTNYNINRVVFNWETAYGQWYDLQISADAVSWTTIYTNNDSDGGTDDFTVSGFGRYVRMYGRERATQWGYSLWEFEVYGSMGPTFPDLVITSVSAHYDPDVNCYTSEIPIAKPILGMDVEFMNVGNADAGPFVVWYQSSSSTGQQSVSGLAAGQRGNLFFPDSISYMQTAEIRIDSLNQVDEADENNNTSIFYTPTGTPLPPCTPTPSVPTDTPTPPPPDDWVYCADEGDTCTFSGTRTVRYGANGSYNYLEATNSIACNNSTFGDPIRGTVKQCHYSSDGGVPTPTRTRTPTITRTPTRTPTGTTPTVTQTEEIPEEWVYCADEGGACTFSGTRTVRYGAESSYNYLEATNSIACNNSTFGDPIVGTVKTCEYQELIPSPTVTTCPGIWGFVLLGSSTGPGLAGVQLIGTTDSVTISGTTDASGYYMLNGCGRIDMVVVPQLAGYTFTPAQQIYSYGDAPPLDFVATASSQ